VVHYIDPIEIGFIILLMANQKALMAPTSESKTLIIVVIVIIIITIYKIGQMEIVYSIFHIVGEITCEIFIG